MKSPTLFATVGPAAALVLLAVLLLSTANSGGGGGVTQLVSAATDPSKPVWPTNFVTPFGLYVVFPPVKNGSADFYYKYDAQAQAQLLDYKEHCIPLVHWDAVGHPCKLYFQPSGIYVHQPATGLECCQLVANVGAVPPDFLKPFTFKEVQNNITDYYGVSHSTNYWTGPDDFGYWTDASSGDDVRFKDGPTGITWRFGSFIVKEQNVNTFKLPDDNCSKKCGFLGAAQDMSASDLFPFFADPMIRLSLAHHITRERERYLESED